MSVVASPRRLSRRPRRPRPARCPASGRARSARSDRSRACARCRNARSAALRRRRIARCNCRSGQSCRRMRMPASPRPRPAARARPAGRDRPWAPAARGCTGIGAGTATGLVASARPRRGRTRCGSGSGQRRRRSRADRRQLNRPSIHDLGRRPGPARSPRGRLLLVPSSIRPALTRVCRSLSLTALGFGGGASTGPPAFFQAPKPPRIWATGFSPMRCAVCAASAERRPPAQKNTKRLSCANCGLW